MPTFNFAKESPVYQDPNETRKYTITTTPWGSSPTSIVMTALDVTDPNNETDVAATVLSGSTSVSGDVITTKSVSSLTKDKDYKIGVQFTDSDSNTWQAYFLIKCR